jgi:hypothetical protein
MLAVVNMSAYQIFVLCLMSGFIAAPMLSLAVAMIVMSFSRQTPARV